MIYMDAGHLPKRILSGGLPISDSESLLPREHVNNMWQSPSAVATILLLHCPAPTLTACRSPPFHPRVLYERGSARNYFLRLGSSSGLM